MFAAYGLLKIVLAKRRSVRHSKSAAYHSASEGSAGHFVQTLKRAAERNEERGPQRGIANFLSLRRSAVPSNTLNSSSRANNKQGFNLRIAFNYFKASLEAESEEAGGRKHQCELFAC